MVTVLLPSPSGVGVILNTKNTDKFLNVKFGVHNVTTSMCIDRHNMIIIKHSVDQ